MRARHIEVFHAIVTEGTVSRAAKRLRVSQPSVTKVLQHAEDELGFPLFHRVKGRLHLTEEGRALALEVQRAQSVLDSVQLLSKRLKQGVQSAFRIAATPALGIEALPDAISRYTERHPRAHFHISTQHSGSLLRTLGRSGHGFDFGFTFGADGAPANVASVEVGAVRLAAVCRRGLLAPNKSVLRFADLTGQRLIGLEEEEPLGRLLAEQFRARGMSPDAPLRVQTYSLACALAAASSSIAIVDALTATSFVGTRSPPTVALLPFERDLRLTVTAVYPLETGLPLAARELVTCFTEALRVRNKKIDGLLESH